jgi:nicotinamidase-related amidase
MAIGCKETAQLLSAAGSGGQGICRAAPADPEDYFVLKPMHSAFYQTPLDLLLRHLGVSSLILAGLATNSCILCTAHDANMRELKIIVPSDCCAARTPREHIQAVENIRSMAGAKVLSFASLRFQKK